MAFFDKELSTFDKISQVAGVASTLGGLISSIGAGKRDLKRRKELAKYENDLAMANYGVQLRDQKQLIQEERDYNDYSSVIKRALKAGVNPIHAVGGSSSIGVQSAAGSPPSVGNGSIPSSGVDPSSNLISAGSTLTAQVRENALLKYNIEKAKAEASIASSEAKWRDKQLAQDYENSVTYKDFMEAGILDKKASARLSTARAECEDIQKEILSVDRNVATATEQMRIDQFRTSLDLALDELRRSNIDTEFKRERVQAELDNLNAMTDSITQHIAIDWKNSEIADMNAHTALKQYGLSREEFVSLDKYRDDMVRLEEQDQILREKLEKRRNTKDYILHATDWINERAKIAAEKDRITNEYGKSASSAALQLLGLAARFAK